MTVPYNTILREAFDAPNGDPWPAGEWTTATGSGLPAPSATVESGAGRIAPGAVGALGTIRRVLYAQQWKDPGSLNLIEFAVTLGAASYGTASSSVPGVLFCWDGNVASPSGYVLAPSKTGTALVLYKVTAGTFTQLASRSMTAPTAPFRVRLRFSAGPFTSNFQFRHWATSSAEPWAATGNGTWSTATDATYSGGRFALINFYDGTSANATVQNVQPSNWVSFDNLEVHRIGTGAPSTSGGAPQVALLTSGFSTTDTTTYATASITPTNLAGTVWLAIVATSGNASLEGRSLAGAGLTWARIANIVFASSARRLEVYRGTGTAAAGALTYQFTSGATSCMWAVLEVSGASDQSADTVPIPALPAVAITGTNQSTSTSASISAGNTVPPDHPACTFITAVAGPMSNTANVITPSGIVTKLVEVQGGSTPTGNLCVAYQAGYSSALSQVFTWPTANIGWGAVAVVIQPSIRFGPQDGASVSVGSAA